ncbi:MAG: hypothetical protein IJ567_09200 [Lachnospiraceae bacterium]|nr:hypothetical protein [Lachnospiraceae bacterium]
MNEQLIAAMSGTPDYEQKELRQQRKALKVRFANGCGLNCCYRDNNGRR